MLVKLIQRSCRSPRQDAGAAGQQHRACAQASMQTMSPRSTMSIRWVCIPSSDTEQAASHWKVMIWASAGLVTLSPCNSEHKWLGLRAMLPSQLDETHRCVTQFWGVSAYSSPPATI